MRYAAELLKNQKAKIVSRISDLESLSPLLSETGRLWASFVPFSSRSSNGLWLFGTDTIHFEQPLATATLSVRLSNEDSVIVNLKNLPVKAYKPDLFKNMFSNINPEIFSDVVWLGRSMSGRGWDWAFLPRQNKIVRPSRVSLY